MHDLSTADLVRMVRDANHELHIRIDGLTPGGDDAAHQNYHRREQDREISEQQLGRLRKAQYWAGIRIGGTALLVIIIAASLYSIFTQLGA